MNPKIIISTVLVLAFAILACGKTEKEASLPVKKTQFSKVVDDYLALKNALVASDAKKAGVLALTLQSAIKEIGKAEKEGNSYLDSLATVIDKVTTQTELADQRLAFFELSEALILAAKFNPTPEKTLYIQHCPMAFNNTGGDWISAEKDVVNPYFGDAMLHCGQVTETIAAK